MPGGTFKGGIDSLNLSTRTFICTVYGTDMRGVSMYLYIYYNVEMRGVSMNLYIYYNVEMRGVSM